MIKLNSHLNDEVLALINDKIAKYKLFYALYFKYYEERNAFFTEQPSFSRSLVVAARFYNHPDPLLSLKVGPH